MTHGTPPRVFHFPKIPSPFVIDRRDVLENKIKDINRMKREHSVRIACAAGTMAFLCGVTAFAAPEKAPKEWGKKLVCRGRRVKCAVGGGGDGDRIGGEWGGCPFRVPKMTGTKSDENSPLTTAELCAIIQPTHAPDL